MFEKGWDKYFEWWVGVVEEHIDLMKRNPFFLQGLGILLQQHLEVRRTIDLLLKEMWRQVRLPPLDEITRLHERLTHLESKLAALQGADRPRGMQPLPEALDKAPFRRYA